MNLALDITNKHQEKFEDTKRAIRGRTTRNGS